MFYYKKIFSANRKLSVLPIVFGVALAFYGDMSFTTIGAVYTLLCVVLAALKAVMGGELLTGDLKVWMRNRYHQVYADISIFSCTK
jgi:drug/metabolite transporter (DMT)-like permease